MIAKIAMLIVFFSIMILVGLYARKKATNVNDFVLGGRAVGPWLTAFAYGTSYFSAVVFVGYAGQFGWKYGISTTWIGLGNAFIGSLLAWAVMGKRTRIMTRHLDAKTMPDFFAKRYGSFSLRIAAAIIVFVFLIPYTASVYNGLSKLFGMAFNIDYKVCVAVMAVLTAAYVILGGYMATAYNDFIQGLIMIGGIIAVIASVLSGQGGFTAAIRKLAEIPSAEMPGVYASFFGPDPVNLLGVIILTSLGTWGLPQMVHKFYAIKSDRAVKIGTIVSTGFAIIVAGGCYFLGGFGRLFEDPSFVIYAADGSIAAVAFDGVIPFMLSRLPDILIGTVIVLVLSASMSTLASLVHTSSSTFTLDFLNVTCCKNMSDKKQLLTMRLLIVFFIAVSVVIALNPPMFIAQLMGISWGALAGAFLAPFLYGIFWKRATKLSVWASFAMGIGITLVNMVMKWTSPINAGAIAMVTGLVLVPAVSFITPRLDKDTVTNAFCCIKERLPEE